MDGLAARISRLAFAVVILLALPLPSAASSAGAASAGAGGPRFLLNGEAPLGGWFSADGSHVLAYEGDAMLSFPVAGGDPVGLGAGFVLASMNDPALVLVVVRTDQGLDELYLVDISTGHRRLMAVGVNSRSLEITNDDRWLVASLDDKAVKIEVATGDVIELPPFPGDVDVAHNEYLYLVPTGEGHEHEVRGVSLDTGVDRLVGKHTFAEAAFNSLLVHGELGMVETVNYAGDRSSERHSFYTIEPWKFLHLALTGPRLSALSGDGRTVYSLGGPCCGSWKAFADKIDGSGLVEFGGGDANEYLGVDAATMRMGFSEDERYASSFIWWFDQSGLPGVPTAYVYDAATHTATALGEGTTTAVTSRAFAEGTYDDFFGSEPRLLIETIGAHGGPTGMFSVNVSGSDARPWPLYATVAESQVAAHSAGDDVYALGDAGLYRLKPDGSAARLISPPGRLTGMSLSPAKDHLTYGVDNRDGTFGLWLLPLDHSSKDCDGPNVIRGSAGPDVLVGTPGNDVIDGLGGDDRIDGRGGDDRICGGAGDDELVGGDGDDVIFGERGHDTIWGGSGSDVIYGSQGRDVVYAGPGWDAAYGGSGADTLRGGSGRDWLHGDSGADEIYGENGRDTVYAGYGKDRIWGGAHSDHLVAALGTNEVFAGRGADVIDLRGSGGKVHGGRGPDQVWWRGIGKGSIPSIWAGGGADLIGYENHGGECGRVYGGSGDDTIRCGGWVAAQDVDTYAGRVVLRGNGGNDSLKAFVGHDVLRGGRGDDWLAAGQGDDRLIGGDGDDTLLGQLGDDYLSGGPGVDQLVGGDGDDVCEDDGGPPVAC